MSVAERLRAPARALGFGAVTVTLLGGLEVHRYAARAPTDPKIRAFWRQPWLKLVCEMMGIEIEVLDEVPAPEPGRGRLVVSNHRSAVDIAVLWILFGGRIVSRADLARWPLLGYGAKSLGTIFVDRDARASGASAIRTMRRALREGDTVNIFPEGTTFPGDEVREFRPGAFAAVRGVDADVVPVGLAYEPGTEFFQEPFVAHVRKVAARRRTRVVVAIGSPRKAATNINEMASELQGDVQTLVHRARIGFDQPLSASSTK